MNATRWYIMDRAGGMGEPAVAGADAELVLHEAMTGKAPEHCDGCLPLYNATLARVMHYMVGGGPLRSVGVTGSYVIPMQLPCCFLPPKSCHQIDTLMQRV
jgi:hypothetical protein